MARMVSVVVAPAASVPTSHRPVAGVVGPLAGGGRDERQPRRQQVRHRDVGGGVRAGVGQGDGEGDRVADVGPAVVHRLGQRQVGLLRRLGGAGLVVGRVGVELVGGGDRGRVGRRAAGCPPGPAG